MAITAPTKLPRWTNPLIVRSAVVAATGLVSNEPAVTTDSDFESVDGRSVELY